ncbi:MAG: B12-binding domain-containing protein [Planctomycetota bacterium]
MQLLSPKQVAKSIGVSESSLKRWCDQGVIRTEKTPGGHRRMLVGDVISFLRETNRPIIDAKLLGLPDGVGRRDTNSAKASATLNTAIEQGEEVKCREVVLDYYLGGANVVQVCEDLLTPAMHHLGDLWRCGQAEVFQERFACEIIGRLLNDLRSMLPTPSPDAPLALGGSPEGDMYRLPTTMVQLVLAESGWKALSLGDNLPYRTILAAIDRRQPAAVWLSVSRSDGAENWLDQLQDFSEQLPAGVAFLLGGRGVAEADCSQIQRAWIANSLASLSEKAAQLRSELAAA